MGSNNFESSKLCPKCGSRVKRKARYCRKCGNRINQIRQKSIPVQYSDEESFTRYTVQKTPYWPMLGSTYIVRDSKQEIMTIRGGIRPLFLVSVIILLVLCIWGVFEPVIFILPIIIIIVGLFTWESIFGKYLFVFSLTDTTGSLLGEIRCSRKRSKWNILNASGRKLGTISLFDTFGGRMKTISSSFTIRTSSKSKTFRSQVPRKFEVYDSNQDLYFSLIGTRHFVYENAELQLLFKRSIDIFLPCSLAICISERYWVDWKLMKLEDPSLSMIEEELQFPEDFPEFSKDVPEKAVKEHLGVPSIKSTLEKEIVIPSISESQIKSFDETRIEPLIGLEEYNYKEPAINDLEDKFVQEEGEDTELLVTTDTDLQMETFDLPSSIEPVSEDKRSLFSSLQYQVQDLIFESNGSSPIARIIPYSGSIKQVTVEFNQNKIIMSGCLKRQNLPLVNFDLNKDGLPSQPSWDDPWQNIATSGEEIMLDRIRTKRGIAEKLNTLNTVSVRVESPKQGEICIFITCTERQDVIESAYSLMKEIQSFCEISLY
ncbi:MAG: zinc ribbon domain-containing protein [Candidatus Heimdallarchaeota archaeon]|nr:MAG: zinc ribbon domain-containing protein [Candidatus Heimdallarchaeota archaeon]